MSTKTLLILILKHTSVQSTLTCYFFEPRLGRSNRGSEMERGPTGRVTREERVFFRSKRTGPPDGGRPLRPPGCTGPILSRPFMPTKRHCQNAAAILRLPVCCSVSSFALANPVSARRTSHRTGPRCAPSIHMGSPPPSRRLRGPGG